MLELDKVDRATFTPCLGQTFEVVFTDGRLPLLLADVRRLGAARPGTLREPFALTFHGAPEVRLPQHIYRLEHLALGALEIFLVQTGTDAIASHFEAVFN
jgi:hypothetical protein